MILRNFVIIGAGLFALLALTVFVRAPEAWPMLVMAVLLIIGTVFERVNYRGSEAHRGQGQWQITEERFLDEASGRLVTVWFNATTGERRYVEQGEPPPR
jgi:hypothetical protein